MLLDASPAEAEAHEARLVDATAEAARLAAVCAALPARIAAAETRERTVSWIASRPPPKRWPRKAPPCCRGSCATWQPSPS